MASVYRQRHPEKTVLYRVLFHYFEEFLSEYEKRFQKAYGYFRPIVQEVVEKYLDCGNPCCGFARIRCQQCSKEYLLSFSCKVRGFCPSCHAKRPEEWGEWMREKLILDVPHRQVVFVIPKMLRTFFKYHRKLQGALCQCAVKAFLKYLQSVTGKNMNKKLISVEWVQKILSWRHTGFHVHSQVRVITKKQIERIGKYMIRPLLSLERLSLDEKEGQVISFLTDWVAVDRIIKHLQLSFVSQRPPPPQGIQQNIELEVTPADIF